MEKDVDITAKEQEDITKSAKALQHDWKVLQSRQKHRGRKRQAEKTGRNIETALFLLKRDGRAMDLQSHKQRFSGLREDFAHEKVRKTYTAYIISEYMKRIREDGWAAVEAGLPPELREVLMKACESKGISTTDKGEKAKERESEQKKQAEHHANKAAAAAFAAPFVAAAEFNPFNPTAYIGTKFPADIAPTKRDALIKSERAAMKHLENLLAQSQAFKDKKIVAYGSTFINSNSMTVKYQTTVNGETVEKCVSGDRVNKTEVLLDEGQYLFEKLEKNEPLNAAEQKRLDEWKSKGVKSTKDFVPQNGAEKSLASKKAGQISEKGLTGKFAEQMKIEQGVYQQATTDRVLETINAKLAQAEFVIRKQSAGLKLDASEQRLLAFAQNTLGEKTNNQRNERKPLTLERLAEMRRPENETALIEFGKGIKTFISDEYGTMISVEKQLAALRESPEKYAEMDAKGVFPKSQTFNPLNVKAGMSLDKFDLLSQKSVRDKKNANRKDEKFFVDELKKFAKNNKESTVSVAAINHARKALEERRDKKHDRAKTNNTEKNSKQFSQNAENEAARVKNAMRKATLKAVKQIFHRTKNSVANKIGLMETLTARTEKQSKASPSPIQTAIAAKRRQDMGR